MKHASIGVLFAAFASVASAQTEGPNASAVAKAELVLATEDVIETLREQVAVLSSSAMNLQVPDVRATRVFEDRIRVVGLAEGAPTIHGTVLDLDVKRSDWPVEAEAREVETDDLRLWSGFLETVSFFHHAKFYTRRGSFDNAERSRFRAESGFKALAQLDGGDLAYVQSDLVIVWAGDAKSKGRGWKVQEILTQSFQLTETERPFFSDVLDSALEDDDRVRARHSLRDEALIEWIVAIGNGSLPVEKAVADTIDATAAGTEPMHMSHVSVVDIDGDGYDDFYVLPSDATAMFFRNRGDGTFEEIADELNLAHHLAEAATFADFDNDGDPDLFLSFFPRETRYFANEDGRFVDRTDRSEDAFPELAIAISPMDYDGDGLLDVYFSRYNGFWVGVMAARMEAARDAGETVQPRFPG
ncbi:MAG: FG-GAP repeat domain-containing protein, partial [Planctomycetota bacterium]